MAPFYYATVFVEGHNLGEESFLMRAVKDIIIIWLVFLWFFNIVIKPHRYRYLKSIDIAVILFMLIGLLKLLIYDSSFSLTFVRFHIEYVIFYFIAKKIYSKPGEIIEDIERIIIVSSIVSIIGMIEYSFGGIETIYSKAAGQTRIISTLFNPNALGWYLSLSSSLLVTFIFEKSELKYLKTKFIQVFILFLNIIAIILTGSRSALLILGIILVISLLKGSNKKAIFIFTFIFLILTITSLSIISIDLGQLRIFNTGIESQRSLIFESVFSFVQNLSLDQLIFGVSNSNFKILKDLAVIFDSQFILDFIIGGLFILFLKYSIIIYLLIRLKKAVNKELRKSLFLFFICFILISFLGNILMIFPHGLYFWFFLGVISSIDINKKTIPSITI